MHLGSAVLDLVARIRRTGVALGLFKVRAQEDCQRDNVPRDHRGEGEPMVVRRLHDGGVNEGLDPGRAEAEEGVDAGPLRALAARRKGLIRCAFPERSEFPCRRASVCVCMRASRQDSEHTEHAQQTTAVRD